MPRGLTPCRRSEVRILSGTPKSAGAEAVASANVRFGRDENTHGRFRGGGATSRFPREAGWGNAMRYRFTSDHWGAEEFGELVHTEDFIGGPQGRGGGTPR
jgi:hypothetical protein